MFHLRKKQFTFISFWKKTTHLPNCSSLLCFWLLTTRFCCIFVVAFQGFFNSLPSQLDEKKSANKTWSSKSGSHRIRSLHKDQSIDWDLRKSLSVGSDVSRKTRVLGHGVFFLETWVQQQWFQKNLWHMFFEMNRYFWKNTSLLKLEHLSNKKTTVVESYSGGMSLGKSIPAEVAWAWFI